MEWYTFSNTLSSESPDQCLPGDDSLNCLSVILPSVRRVVRLLNILLSSFAYVSTFCTILSCLRRVKPYKMNLIFIVVLYLSLTFLLSHLSLTDIYAPSRSLLLITLCYDYDRDAIGPVRCRHNIPRPQTLSGSPYPVQGYPSVAGCNDHFYHSSLPTLPVGIHGVHRTKTYDVVCFNNGRLQYPVRQSPSMIERCQYHYIEQTRRSQTHPTWWEVTEGLNVHLVLVFVNWSAVVKYCFQYFLARPS